MDLPCRLGPSAGRASRKGQRVAGPLRHSAESGAVVRARGGVCVKCACEAVVARYPLYQEVLRQQGVSTRLVVLYVPDYVSNAARLAKTSQMWQVLSRMLPTYDITLPLVEGPFQDPAGLSAFFDKGKGGLTPARLVQSVKRDFLLSLIHI